ncbi:Tubulin polymerization-promoting protein, putative [Perkinsus marinus ATCC 50983]|uniref:Tubulin polymerization-promoting protein, putative n=1 Tax=Perkinsus marinus (strain ATCC 50983 / TXsc) TaxID=423536 RepID=C5LU23_PERM5|nr:Tubulin polymerization-promoting protein, putative [Perkinsus marinus ATCC 50983]EEQ99821.1 Tubulin polymerization-promoting protein, putative [Perkinsus marinus ATCC 50983]|eukprot:XP_002767104.1 Tubulin polymerization-promoting protein, putative [Perkinsus marinus ATCC 50983]
MATANLLEMYKAFTGGDTMMDGRQFAKLCRDCNIVDKKGLSVNDTDIVFAKVRSRGERKINFGQFLEAIGEVWRNGGPRSVDSGRPSQQAIGKTSTAGVTKRATGSTSTPAGKVSGPRRLAGASVPPLQGRGPERFFYDTSTYTGVHKAGGPETIDNHDKGLVEVGSP